MHRKAEEPPIPGVGGDATPRGAAWARKRTRRTSDPPERRHRGSTRARSRAQPQRCMPRSAGTPSTTAGSTAHDSATTASAALIPKATASADRSAGSATTRPVRSSHRVTADPARSAGGTRTLTTCTTPSAAVHVTCAGCCSVGTRWSAAGACGASASSTARTGLGGAPRPRAASYAACPRSADPSTANRPSDISAHATRSSRRSVRRPGSTGAARRRVRVRRMHRESPEERVALPTLVGTASEAAQAMELGCDAVLLATAVTPRRG